MTKRTVLLDAIKKAITKLPEGLKQPIYIMITPGLAKMMLSRILDNRRMSKRTVAKYVRAMKLGMWGQSGNMIVSERENLYLLNGVQRLNAIIESGLAQGFYFVTLPHASIRSMDQGKARLPQDFFSSKPYRVVLASAAAYSYSYDLGSFPPNRTELIEMTEKVATMEDPKLQESSSFIHSLEGNGSVLVDQGLQSFLHRFYHDNLEDVQSVRINQFFERLRSGNDISKGDPVGALRSKLYEKPTAAAKRVYLVNALKAHLEYRKVTKLNYQKGKQFPSLWLKRKRR